MKAEPAKLAKNRLNAERSELAERILSSLLSNGVLEIFPGVTIYRSSTPTHPLHSVFTPAFCVIAQGSKQVVLGDESFKYDTGHYLIATLDLPIVSCVLEASEEKPYLSFRVDLDPALVANVLMESGVEIDKGGNSVKAMNVSSLDADLLNAVVRILRLVEKPDEEAILL